MSFNPAEITWIEGRSPSQINDSMREIMRAVSKTWQWSCYRAGMKTRAQAAKLAKKRRK